MLLRKQTFSNVCPYLALQYERAHTTHGVIVWVCAVENPPIYFFGGSLFPGPRLVTSTHNELASSKPMR